MIELAAAIRAGELSPVAVTDHYLRRTTELNDQVGAFYTITPEFAADQAREAEKQLTQRRTGLAPGPAPLGAGLGGRA